MTTEQVTLADQIAALQRCIEWSDHQVNLGIQYAPKKNAALRAVLATLQQYERIARLEGVLGKFNEIVLRSNGVGKSELIVDIECADYGDAADLFDLIEDMAALTPTTPAGKGP